MPSTENRLSTLEDGTGSPLPPASREHIAMMVGAGIPRARAEEIDKAWPDVTILTDAELDRLLAGEPPDVVLARLL